MFLNRTQENQLNNLINRGQSILLLGPRQVGKTSMLKHGIHADMNYTLVDFTQRQQLELNPNSLLAEIKGYKLTHPQNPLPLVIIDEIQKVPQLMDTIQLAIDEQLARFILTGSSTRKLKRHIGQMNLLPGRLIQLYLDGLTIQEFGNKLPTLEDLLLYGSLPGIALQSDTHIKEQLLTTYVQTYLEEEVRAEAVTRDLANFSRFLNYAAVDAGKLLNTNALSQEIGISRYTISEYYQILEDCLIATRIEPFTQTVTRRRLSKAPKYLFFDLGVRRIAAKEGTRLPQKYYGDLFEQSIGLEILKLIHLNAPQFTLRYWRDHNGPEVDYVLTINHKHLPIEVKYTSQPKLEHAKHLQTFMNEYDCHKPALLICQIQQTRVLTDDIIALPWQTFIDYLSNCLKSIY